MNNEELRVNNEEREGRLFRFFLLLLAAFTF